MSRPLGGRRLRHTDALSRSTQRAIRIGESPKRLHVGDIKLTIVDSEAMRTIEAGRKSRDPRGVCAIACRTQHNNLSGVRFREEDIAVRGNGHPPRMRKIFGEDRDGKSVRDLWERAGR